MDSDSADDQPLLKAKAKRPKKQQSKKEPSSSKDSNPPSTKKQKTAENAEVKKENSFIGGSDSDDDIPLGKKPNKKLKKLQPKIQAAKVKRERKPSTKKAKLDPDAPGLEKNEASSKKPVRVKKMYDKLGQKFDEPNHLDCLRLFYESLYSEEKETSGSRTGRLSMAEQWCMERGLFTIEQHESLYKRHVRAG